jgi:phosphoribosyl-ATP pyrophosphohydrolase
MRDYRALLEAGNKAQLEKLKENEHKEGWDNINMKYAINRLNEEVDELIIAKHRGYVPEIRREAADIANFAHMVVLACDRMMGDQS